MIIVIYHYANAISLPMSLKEAGVATDVNLIQIFFLCFIFLMDLLKHGVAFSSVWGYIEQHGYWYYMTIIQTVDWVLRMIFIVCMLFPITQYFGNTGLELNNYIRATTA